MNIHPRPDQERAIQEAMSAGLIGSEIDILDIGLESLRSRLIRFDGLNSQRTPQEAAKHIRELRQGNSLPTGVTLRDLINEGRA
jgi:hypothetical protein